MSVLQLLLPLFAVLVTSSSSVVQTNTGPVQGKMLESGKVEVFLGIPYAEPPIGLLRFSKPRPKPSWQDIYDATHMPVACIQVEIKGTFFAPDPEHMSEDCLFLNLWVPRSESNNELKTIMIFIHGGGFVFGASNVQYYDGAKLAEYGDVIVASINYRLGGLGFFTDFTDDAPGSVGLYDQVMAIQWIKDNAKHFNGNPENIVLFGESAGSWSVSLHQVSPLSRYIFNRAILQSGSALSPIYDDNNAKLINLNQDYADYLDCTNNDTTFNNVLDCLRKVPAERFSEADNEIFLKTFTFPIPRVGNDFLPDSTIDAFRKGHFKDSEVLLGITSNEGSILITLEKPELFGQFGEKVSEATFNETTAYHTIKDLISYEDSAEIDKIISDYMEDITDKPKYTYLKATSEAVGDFLITCGKIFQAEYQSMRGNPVFFYMFDHRPSSSPFTEWMGVAHADELQFVFGNPMFKHFTEYETELSKDIMDMWISFAKTGNPNIPGGVSWPRYTYRDSKYFIIGKRDSVGIRPDHYRCERWRKLYRSVIDEDVIEALKQH